MSKSPPRKCTATTAKKTPCRAFAVRNSQPPRCAAHRGGKRPVGAPEGNKNAETHGVYAQPLSHNVNLAERIADLDRRIERLSIVIDGLTIGDGEGEISIDAYTKLVSLYGQLVSRLGRLMRDQQQLGGGEDSELDRAIDAALDMASDILGVEL